MQFTLIPFEKKNLDYSIFTKLHAFDLTFFFEFEIRGPLEKLLIPSLSAKTQRLDGIWEKTCFEVFFKTTKNPSYWELNVSPSGDWNLYFFSRYRFEKKIETKLQSLVYKVAICEKNTYKGEIFLEFKNLIPKKNSKKISLLIGLNTILEHKNKSLTHWAIKHADKKPDFHSHENFSIKIKI